MDRYIAVWIILLIAASLLTILVVQLNQIPRSPVNPGGTATPGTGTTATPVHPGSGGSTPYPAIDTPVYPDIPSPSQQWNISLRGISPADQELARIVSRMIELPVDDPRIAPYIEWIRKTVTLPHDLYPYRNQSSEPYIVVDIHSGVGGREPAPGSTVLTGYAILPYGVGVVLTFYRDQDNVVNAVVHGTIVNETAFYEFYLKAAAYLTAVNSPYWDEVWYQFSVAYRELSPYDSDCVRAYKAANYSVFWFLWRASIPGGYIRVGDSWLPLRVHLVMEMPMIGAVVPQLCTSIYYIRYPDRVGLPSDSAFHFLATFGYQQVFFHLMHPVFAIASRLIGAEPTHLARSIVYDGIESARSDVTPLSIRLSGSMHCESATAVANLLMSAMGYPMIDVGIRVGEKHAISGILRLSSLGEQGAVSLAGHRGWYRLSEKDVFTTMKDLDFDGVDDSFDVFVDTSMLPIETIQKAIDDTTDVGVYSVCLPGLCFYPGLNKYRDQYIKSLHDYLTIQLFPALLGIPDYLMKLPDWLKTPALIRYQPIVEKYTRMLLTNYSLIDRSIGFAERSFSRCRDFFYDEETGAFGYRPTGMPVDNRSYHLYPRVLRNCTAMARVLLRLKGVGPGDLAPPSSPGVRALMGAADALYVDTVDPDNMVYLEEYAEYWRRLHRQRELEELRRRVVVQLKPVFVEEDIYYECLFYCGRMYLGRVRYLKGYNGSTVFNGYPVYVDVVVSGRRLNAVIYEVTIKVRHPETGIEYTALHLPVTIDKGLNGTVFNVRFPFEFSVLVLVDDVSPVVDAGEIVVSESDLYVHYVDTITVYDGSTGQLVHLNDVMYYIVNEVVYKRLEDAVIVVRGVFRSWYAWLEVLIYGSRFYYIDTVEASLQFPDGRRVRLEPVVDSRAAYVTIVLPVESLLTGGLHGAVIQMRIPSINLTVTVRIPRYP